MKPLTLILALGCVLFGLSSFAYHASLTPATARPQLGVRGVKRSSALGHLGFRLLEPLLRFLAGSLSRMPLGRVRNRLRQQVRAAGDVAGLSPDELLAACALSGASGFAVGLWAKDYAALPFLPWLVGPACSTLPLLWLQTLARRRVRQIERDLPSSVELAALCMGAGLDFPGSLAQVSAGAGQVSDPLAEEFVRVLQELLLGYTRKRALQRLADRVPSDAILQFCNSVIQAEEKGTPVARALLIQAQTLRLQRSIAAEERASGAALRLMGPMALVFLSVILLVVAPLVVRFASGEFRLL